MMNNRNKWHLAVSICGIALILETSVLFAAELSGTPEELRRYLQSETRTVSIRDEAMEVGYTDIAKITLAVVTESRLLASAIEENLAIRDRVRSQMLSAGVDESDIRSSKYSASPQFGWFGKNPNSYEIVNSLEIKVDEEALFRRISEIADSEDTVRFSRVEFEHSDKSAYEDLVRDKAVDAVLENSAYFEKKLGLKLVPVSFSFGDIRSGGRSRFEGIEEIKVSAQRIRSDEDAVAAPPASFDEVEYSVTVEITFEVKQPD